MSLIQRLLSEIPILQNMLGAGRGFLGNLFGRKDKPGKKDEPGKNNKTSPSLIEQGLNLQGIKLVGGFIGDCVCMPKFLFNALSNFF